MREIVREIIDYTEYLKKEHSLNISFHMKAEFSDRFAACSEILPYNSHVNPYCTYIKGKSFGKCIGCQNLVFEKCGKKKFFTGECHAGVLQYIHAVENSEGVMGFVSVSGYEGKKRRPYGDRLYESSVIHEPVCEKFLKTVISPLAHMLGMMMSEPISDGNNDFEKIRAFVNEYHTTITLDMVCDRLHFSRSYISHTFRANTGYTLKSYCNLLKISDAKKLLAESELSVTEVAFAAGFENISYFISVFKKLVGETPLSYRKNCRQRLLAVSEQEDAATPKP